MALHKKQSEIRRLISAFEAEADKFHEISLSIYTITQSGPNPTRRFISPNHAVMLWQYYGRLDGGEESAQGLAKNLQESDLKWGLRGAELSLFAVVEGPKCDLFVRMAKRAGALFSNKEAEVIKTRLNAEVLGNGGGKAAPSKTVFAANGHPLAIWLNYLLYHLSKTNPGREKIERIEPEPFALSMLALERLAENPSISKSDRSLADVEKIHFRVAVSFPGPQRTYVSEVVQNLRKKLGTDELFYDFDYQSQLARPNLDTLLQDIYRNRSDLLVVFLDKHYAEREWCGVEWRAIRDIIKCKEDRRVMLVRCDNAEIAGVFSIDGYINAQNTKPALLAKYVLERLEVLGSG